MPKFRKMKHKTIFIFIIKQILCPPASHLRPKANKKWGDSTVEWGKYPQPTETPSVYGKPSYRHFTTFLLHPCQSRMNRGFQQYRRKM